LEAVKKCLAKKKGLIEVSNLEKAKSALQSPDFNIEPVLKTFALSNDEIRALKKTAKDKRLYHVKCSKKNEDQNFVKMELEKNGGMKVGGKIPTPVQKLQAYIEIYTDKLDSADCYEERLNLMR
jgi:hypothetical protein